MRQILRSVDWVSILSSLEIDDVWSVVKSIFQDTINFTELFSLEKEKNKLWKRYLITCSASDLSNFKSVNNQLRSLT